MLPDGVVSRRAGRAFRWRVVGDRKRGTLVNAANNRLGDMTRFRSKPVEIEAWQWTCESAGQMRGVCNCHMGNWGSHLHTMHGDQIVMLEPGDWIVPEPVPGRYYPIKEDVFVTKYEPIP